MATYVSRILLSTGALALLVGSASAAPVLFDFNSGTTNNGLDPEGWTAVVGARANFALTSGNGAGGRGARGGGTDDTVHDGLLFVSPAFTLDPNSTADLTFELSGGRGMGSAGSWGAYVPGSQSQVLGEIAANGGLSSSTTTGKQGVALARFPTGQYVLTKEKSVNANTWEPLSFTRAELDALISTYGPDERYTFQYFEYRHGSWGHTEMDNVSIPAGDVSPRIGDAGFEGTIVAGGWNSFYADTAELGVWRAPLYGDRLVQNSTGGLNGKYLSHTATNPAGQGTFFYQAIEGSELGWPMRLVFDYRNTDSAGEPNKITWGVWAFDDPVPNLMFSYGNSRENVFDQHTAYLVASGSLTPGTTADWQRYLSEFFVIPGGKSRLVIGLGDFGVYPADGDMTAYDNVTLLASVPEPATLALLGLAVPALMVARGRSRRSG